MASFSASEFIKTLKIAVFPHKLLAGLLPLIGLIGGTLRSSAYTYEDLYEAGTDVIEVVMSEHSFGPVPVVTSGSADWIYSKDPASGKPLVMLARMLDGNVNMDIELDNTTVTFFLSPSAWTNNIEGKQRISQYYVSAQTFGYIIPANFVNGGYKHFVLPSSFTDGAWCMQGTVSENSYGGLHLDMPAPFLVYIFDSHSGRLISKYKHHGFYMDTYRPNATVEGVYTDRLRTAYQENGTYRALFSLNHDGSLTALNWGNLGVTCTAGDNGAAFATAPWTGSWDIASGRVTIDAARAGWASCDSARTVLPQYLGHRSDITGLMEGVTGSITAVTNMRHSAADGGSPSQWVSDGGRLHTLADLAVDFGAMDLVAPGISAIHPQCVDDVVRSYPPSHASIRDVDITQTNASLCISAFYIIPPMGNDPQQYLVIEGSLSLPSAFSHVSGYELCIIPGHHNDATSADFSDVGGHILAYTTGVIADTGSVHSLATANDDDAVPADEAATLTYEFRHRVATADLPAADPDHKYTLFVRTNYTDESGLAPTYSALTRPPVPTAVDGITTDSDGCPHPVEYYTTDGRRVAASPDMNTNPDHSAPRILIRRQGHSASKILRY